MTVAVVGATPANLAAVSGAVSGIRVHGGSVPSGASWVIVATAAQRRQAAASSGLPAFRIVQVPGLDRDGALNLAVLAEGLTRMREIGAHADVPSATAVAITRQLMPWIRPALERWLGEGAVTAAARLAKKSEVNAQQAVERREYAERRAAREREGLVKPVTPEQARRRAERKAQRKAERRAKEPLVSDAPAKRGH